MIFNSTNYCTSQSAYEALFSHDRGTDRIIIKNDLITNETVARARARSELLSGGYAEKWLTITCLHINGLKQNDVIFARGFKWIIKEISYSYSAPKLIATIKGVRYE